MPFELIGQAPDASRIMLKPQIA